MTAPTTEAKMTEPMPAATLPAPDESKLNLDERITLAEERLMARDLALQRGFHVLTDNAREALKPAQLFHSMGKSLGVGGSIALGAVGLLWWWRQRQPSLATGSSARQGGGREEGGSSSSLFSLASIVGLAWPLMPEGIRGLMSPAMARILVSLGVPALSSLLGSRPSAPLPTMTSVDPTRFAGDWFAVAHLPMRLADSCEGLTTVRYAMKRPGQYAVTVRCPAAVDRVGGKARTLRGVARLVRGSGGGKLQLSVWPRMLRWLPLAWSDHWILHLDADYGEAMVGSPRRDALWLLSRDGVLPAHRLEYLLTMARDDGFPIENLRFAEGGDRG